MNMIRSVCVFCGSSPGAEPIFMQSAEHLGRLLAENGLRLVYGGGNHGLMGMVARSVLAHGGKVTGIIPDFLKSREAMLEGADEMIVTTNMHERKMLMFEKADAFVALPGGIGTLEELVEQMTWVQLGQHDKPVVIANIAQFWKPLIYLLRFMENAGFIQPNSPVTFSISENITECVDFIKNHKKAAHHSFESSNF